MFWNLFNFDPKPFNSGYLSVGDGHSLYFYEVGNPKGLPVLHFHGGPGSQNTSTKHAKLFDLKKYRVIMFKQRGTGLSQFANLTYKNDTPHLIDDAKKLLDYLKIKTPVTLLGGSWGSTLALLFAEKYPKLVNKLILSQIFLARSHDTNWLRTESFRFYPDLGAKMQKLAGKMDIVKHCHKLAFSPHKKDQMQAMQYFGSYEYMLGTLAPKFEKIEFDANRLQALRVFLHYDIHNYFLKENEILKNIKKIQAIPSLIIHNRMDFCCPCEQAFILHQELPASKLYIVDDYGHSSPKQMKILKKLISDFA
jgi:proline iminopeptidase